MTSATATKSGASPKKVPIIVGALLAAGVLVALLIALTAGGGDDATVDAPSDARIPQGSTRQVSFAEALDASLPKFDATTADTALGMTAPAFTASYFDNTETTITPGDGTPKIILFLAHWCPHCQAEVQALTEWAATNDAAGIEIVAVSTSVDEGAPNYPPSAWLLREQWPYPVLRDSGQGTLAASYGLASFPYLVAVDGDGTVVSRTSGQLPAGQWDAIVSSLAG